MLASRPLKGIVQPDGLAPRHKTRGRRRRECSAYECTDRARVLQYCNVGQNDMGKSRRRFRAFFRKKWTWLVTAFVVIVTVGSVAAYFWQRPTVLSQRAISSLKPVTIPTSGQRVLIFSPHADDETIATAGFITEALRNNADVRIVLVTDCNKHHNEDLRYTEFKNVAAILTVEPSNLIFLGLPDGKLSEQDPNTVRLMLKEQLDSYDPQVVVYPHPKDMHPDHATTGKLVADILKGEPKIRTAFEYLVHFKLLYPEPRKFDPNLYMLPPKSLVTPDVQWQRVDLPQDVEDIKTQAAFTYRSQLRNIELRDLILSSIRKNELLAVPAK